MIFTHRVSLCLQVVTVCGMLENIFSHTKYTNIVILGFSGSGKTNTLTYPMVKFQLDWYFDMQVFQFLYQNNLININTIIA